MIHAELLCGLLLTLDLPIKPIESSKCHAHLVLGRRVGDEGCGPVLPRVRRSDHYEATTPPSITSSAPVTHAASSDARYTHPIAMS